MPHHSLRLRCRVRRSCGRCGCTYERSVTRAADEPGRTEEHAAEQARRRVVRELAAESADPCPQCGYRPAAAVVRAFARRHGWVTAAGVGAIVLVAVASALGDWSAADASGLAAAACVFTAAGHLAVRLLDPNRRPAASADDTVVVSKGNPDQPAPTGPTLPLWPRFGVAATAAAGLVALTPWLAERRAGGDVLIAVPGEPARVRFAETIECVPDAWTGQVKVTVRGASTNHGIRGSGNTVNMAALKADPRTLRNPPRSSPTLYADLVVPAEARLLGSLLDLRVEMDVTYFGFDSRGAVVERSLTAARDVKVRVSATGGRSAVGGLGSLFAGLMVLFAGLFLRTLAAAAADAARRPEVDIDEVAVARPDDADHRPTGRKR